MPTPTYSELMNGPRFDSLEGQTVNIINNHGNPAGTAKVIRANRAHAQTITSAFPLQRVMLEDERIVFFQLVDGNPVQIFQKDIWAREKEFCIWTLQQFFKLNVEMSGSGEYARPLVNAIETTDRFYRIFIVVDNHLADITDFVASACGYGFREGKIIGTQSDMQNFISDTMSQMIFGESKRSRLDYNVRMNGNH